MNKDHKNGFTLAEVLITLTIIGVIAALTIPNLIQAWKKHQVEVGVKEAYTIISNALNMAKAENGGYDEMFSAKSGNEFASDYVVPYLKLAKDCGVNTGLCAYPKAGKYGKQNTAYDGSYIYGLNGKNSIMHQQYQKTRYLKLANGMNLYITGSGLQKPAGHNESASVSFWFDINGNKEPNLLGYDIFVFCMFKPWSGALNNCANPNSRYCSKGGVLLAGPAGSATYDFANRPNDPNREDCSINGTGEWCSGLIMHNSWKIPDDYPVKKF